MKVIIKNIKGDRGVIIYSFQKSYYQLKKITIYLRLYVNLTVSVCTRTHIHTHKLIINTQKRVRLNKTLRK